MANILKKIFFPKSEWKILDFIKENADSIAYWKTQEYDKQDVHIGTAHHFRIDNDGEILSAECITYNPVNSTVKHHFSYTFKPKGNVFIRKPLFHDSFATTVYTTMVNQYIANNYKSRTR